MRYDSFESLSLSIPLLQWVSENFLKTCRNLSYCLLYIDLYLSSGSTYLSRSVSSAFHFLRNHQRSGVWKLHQGTFNILLATCQILVISLLNVIHQKQEILVTKFISGFFHLHSYDFYKDVFCWFYFIFVLDKFPSASTRDQNKRTGSGKPENHFCETTKTGKGNCHFCHAN